MIVLALMVLAGGFKILTMKSAGGPGGGVTIAQQGRLGAGSVGGVGGGPIVSAIAVKRHTFVDTIEVLGVAKGIQSVTLAAAATQLVERVRFSDGQYVQRGAILVELKDTEQGAGVTQRPRRG